MKSNDGLTHGTIFVILGFFILAHCTMLFLHSTLQIIVFRWAALLLGWSIASSYLILILTRIFLPVWVKYRLSEITKALTWQINAYTIIPCLILLGFGVEYRIIREVMISEQLLVGAVFFCIGLVLVLIEEFK